MQRRQCSRPRASPPAPRSPCGQPLATPGARCHRARRASGRPPRWLSEVVAVADVRTVRNVELLKVGTWDGLPGAFTVTAEHLAAAVEAHEAGVLRKPPLKVGHDDPRFDGGPALGYVD